jgi:CxxC motif-containing protein (DUF1111 family)
MAKLACRTLMTCLAASLVFGQGAVRPVAPGDPLPGLSGMEFELFRMGQEDFTEVETPEDGLGPAFNGTSCAICHSVPAIGGISPITEVRGGYRDADGRFQELNGGTLYHLFSIPNHLCQVRIPSEANVIARRAPIPVFGAGLVEAIADEDIIALEDPDDRNGDGIRGRAARINDIATGRERIGRFGWKAQQATLLAFAADAYRNEMGITNDLFPDEVALGVTTEAMALCNPRPRLEDVRDRRTGMRGIDNFENFMRFLAPLGRGEVTEQSIAGEQLFNSIGCATCHIPSLTTGPSSNPLFDRKPVPLYSDLLLHDIGTGDGIEQGAATGAEVRTPALWGVRLRRPLMRDGGTTTYHDAILRHRGEASAVTERYLALHPDEQTNLLVFLNSL